MTTELQQRQSREVLNPATGELLDLKSASGVALGEGLEAVRDFEARLRETKSAISEELHERMDANASWTLHTPDFDLRGESPDRTDYDTDKLINALDELCEQGYVSRAAYEAAVKEEVTYKPQRRGIQALLKLGGEVAERILSCQVPVERPRRVSIARKR